MVRLATGLDSLPSELLFQILGFLNFDDPHSKLLPLRSKRFRPLDPISRVSRRLRYIALVFLRRNVVCKSIENLERITNLVDYNWEDAMDENCLDAQDLAKIWRASLIRTIRVGHPDYPWYSDIGFSRSHTQHFSYHNYGDPLPFPNLESFECVASVVSTTLVLSLEHCRELENLVLGWNDQTPFPCIRRMPRLKTLRLYLSREEYVPHPANFSIQGIPPYPSITTLALHDCCEHSDVITQAMKLSFPHLHVLRLEQLYTSVPLVFDFVQRHPTIREANIHFITNRDCALRIEALPGLIYGTGTWMPLPDKPGVKLDQPSEMELPDDEDEEPNPPLFHEYYGPFYRFAFSRRPCNQAALQWRSSLGSDQPRYVCTGLAIDLCEDEPLEECRDNYNLQDFMTAMQPLFSDLRELRITSWAVPWKWLDFRRFMRESADQLDKWRHLRKFVFHMPFESPCAQWEKLGVKLDLKASTREDMFDRSRLQYIKEMKLPFLDEPNPPAFSRARPLTLASLRHVAGYSDHDFGRLQSGIRCALCLDDNVDLDEDDPHLLMRAWEAHNYPRVSHSVRELASRCGRLQEFDWYVINTPNDDVVLWRWKIIRRDDNTIRYINGNLTWSGCLQGHPPPFPVWVGQELDYTARDSGGKYWWW